MTITTILTGTPESLSGGKMFTRRVYGMALSQITFPPT
jgi:hypothetical protein